MMKKTVHGWEIISNLDIRLYQDEAGGVVILLDKDGFGDQVPVLLNFDDDGVDIKALSHLTKSVRVLLDKKVRIEWHDEYFEERTQAMEYIEVERD
ncbi:hypothetical protein HS43_04565 [Listeria monocytogenes]|uniref:DUF2283 domain-containing protein n=3 Tax=Listeria monocytogenes TaxID=1639 RepID=A0AAX0HEU1_LISMN|nr:hypothetical protein M637_04145 [Listeria monocytogenes]ALD11459.1 hypothetical protein LM220_22795 [Listeria monocytogenes J1816]ASH34218.1 hypothetical protein A409_0312 [Listeria monocytogenes serotype 1/2b str. 10-0810]ASH37185.1 hypothetical protein A410_0316 [Listeria monocytogenes serotype 1/2b str. 10-0811]EAL10851.1 conserved hypothetical protein [Listeria monocytogenes str. 4b H7858] [Listeria monocytogenes serotype 4b str. H7858]ERH77564.1 hypothetical protein O167_04480 [Listeri